VRNFRKIISKIIPDCACIGNPDPKPLIYKKVVFKNKRYYRKIKKNFIFKFGGLIFN